MRASPLHSAKPHMKHWLYMLCQVVIEDEHENGIRSILNFGHSIGHAIEALKTVPVVNELNVVRTRT